MAYKNLIYQKDGGIATVTINRPEVMNALSQAALAELKAAIEEAGKDDDVLVVILTGAGRAFSAGRDFQSLADELKEAGEGPLLKDAVRDATDAIVAVPKVVIAMVNGYCLTGALEIALGCDLIVASEAAKFGDTHARYGLRAGAGLSQRLPRLVGILKAKELSFTADIITAQEAERIGLVNMLVPAEKLESAVRDLANKIMANSRDSIAAYKYLYNAGMMGTMERGMELEATTDFVIRDTEERIRKFGKKS